MIRKFCIILLIFIAVAQAIRMKRICFLPTGPFDELCYLICYDTDHDGSNELIFSRIVATYISAWMIWEYRPLNNYEFVFADTGAYPYPPGITTGNFRPYDVGDIDQDSLTDLLGHNVDKTPDTLYYIIITQESPSLNSYPESLSWYFRYSNSANGAAPSYFTMDFDNDTKNEIIKATPTNEIATGIWENVTNNQNELVWHQSVGASRFAFGDFDLDERKEFVTANLASLGRVSVYENIADNQYEMIYQDTVYIPNGLDVFSGHDLDGDEKEEFFVVFALIGGSTSNFYLYMWEATGNNTYERTFLFSQNLNVQRTTGRRSICADIDGDSIEELIWATPINITVYEAIGNNQFQPLWQWWQDHGQNECVIVNSYDMNKNGYNEIVVGGSGKISIFEIEAVKVLRPNGGENFVSNTQEQIRWQKFYPPRCDSLSLFYSLNNSRTYDTIINGLAGADSSYLWTVPDTSSDSCKVKIIAYGPGWQYDESDGVFTITPSGINEIASPKLAITSIELYPNPAGSFLAVRLSPTADYQMIKMFDVMGKLVNEIASPSIRNDSLKEIKISLKGINPGIYFLRIDKEIKKFIITK